MITVELMGGLGNQMFQYAAGRALSLSRGTPLRLDLSWYGADPSASGSTQRSYALSPFCIESTLVRGRSRGSLAYRARRCVQIATRERVLVDRGSTVDSRIATAPHRARLIGYWQSEEYFRHHAAVVRSDFAVRDAIGDDLHAYRSMLAETESIAVHVRRSDYVLSPAASTELGALPSSYYQKAATRLLHLLGDAEFFVFSDDLSWCKDNLALPGATTFVDVGREPWHDLVLLSSCRHHIIANSSFSWWGAWLAEHPNQHVIAPARWFADGRACQIVPERWCRL